MLSDAAAPAPVSVGQVLLGRYRVTSLLAEGGHSLIYRAEDERLRRPACVKVLRFATQDESLRSTIEERFVQEAFLLARLCHPATLRIFDFGYLRLQLDGVEREVPFQVTELVGGGPLSRWVKKRERITPPELTALISPLARALAEVHGAGVVHLDIKPQNVLLARTAAGREPKLADFGIAETMARKSPERRSVLLYSVNWAAPEQMVGDPIGPASDTYALALVAVYALTGRLVFCEPDPARAYSLRRSSSRALAEALEGVPLPEALFALFDRALRFDPGRRFDDVLDLAFAIERLLRPSGDQPIAPPATNEESGPSPTDSGLPERSLADRVTAASLWPLDPRAPCPAMAGRTVAFCPAGNGVDLDIAGGIRLRVSLVGDAGRPGLHVKGRNCFVCPVGGRPTSAVTVDGSTSIEFLSAGGEVQGRAEIVFGVAGPEHTVLSFARQTLITPADLCPQLVAVDCGVGATCTLLYGP